MRTALFIPLFDELSEPSVAVDIAVVAEAAGWDGVFVWDHLLYRPPVERIADPWTVMAAMAQATERVVLGPMVTPIARRRPQVLARQTATLDRLSNGRLVFGVGLGGDPGGELSRFDEEMDAACAAKLLDDGLEHIDRWWRGEEANGVHVAAAARPAAADPDLGRVAVPEPRAGPAGGAVGRLVPDRAHVARRPRRCKSRTAKQHRPADAGPWDVAVQGLPDDDPAPWVAAGATWWLVRFEPFDLPAAHVREVARQRAAARDERQPCRPRRDDRVGQVGAGAGARPPALATSSSSRSTRCRCTAAWTSARPSRRSTEQAEVPHHLIDLVDPDEDFTVARFQRAFVDVARRHRGAWPPRAARRRHRPLPARRRRRPRPSRGGIRRRGASSTPSPTAVLHDDCARSTRSAPARMEPTNRRRIVRALEVTIGSGRPFSSFGPGLEAYPPTPFRLVGLALPPTCVAARIEARYHRQIAAGFLDEVRAPAGADPRAVADRGAGARLPGARSPTSTDERHARRGRSTTPCAAPGSSPAASGRGSAAIPASTGSTPTSDPLDALHRSSKSCRARRRDGHT